MNDNLLDPFVWLFETLSKPKETAFLGESLIDECGGELRYLLQQRGEIQRIARAVAHIHQNMDQPVSVEELAEMAHMGQTSFYENFKSMMHMSPLQYAKTVKLD